MNVANIAVPIPVPTAVPLTTVKQAIVITGGLCKSSKMPWKSWGIPIQFCPRGSILRDKEGTVCNSCYAAKGRFVFRATKAAYMRRYQAYMHRDRRQWIEAMAFLLAKQARPENPYFRVFDSGDLQDLGMLKAWAEIARRTPTVKFWLVTRERGIVRRFLAKDTTPDNLLIRVSGDMFDDEGPTGFANIATTSTVETKVAWKKLVNLSTKDHWHCPAPLQDNSCADCRACWDHDVIRVTYKKH